MTDQEFEKLQKDIKEQMMELNRLQDLHHKETGRYFILGQPIVSKRIRLWGEPSQPA
jgi:hypothetical protein